VRSSRYGEIPLVERSSSGADGKVYRWWEPDPDYKPKLPPGAVRGDVRRQVFCSACHEAKYFFLDETRACIQCTQSFTFSATEQKYWYETLRFNFNSVPIRCVRCRRQRRSQGALMQAVAVAKASVRSHPEDPAGYLALARAVVELRSRLGNGNLNDAISAARKAADLWPESPEPIFWEGMAHVLAGRRIKGQGQLSRFISAAAAAPTSAGLVQNARRVLDEGT
jgi:hypothetical protein